MSLRTEFPSVSEDYLGGESDGLVYTSVFAGASLAHSYEMIRQFLVEEGYEDIPVPEDVAELAQFRLNTRNRQILMYEDNGYIHNPVKILFPKDYRQKRKLYLKIYNEEASQHLLRFHGKLEQVGEQALSE